MHLIELTLKSQQRRLRFEHWLLMLLRCAIPILLALCMARPILKGTAALWSNAKTSLLVVLDNSYSLDFKGAGGATSRRPATPPRNWCRNCSGVRM